MNNRLPISSILEALNSLSPTFHLVGEGNTAAEIENFRAQLGLALPPAYEDFLATVGATPGLKLLRDADFSTAAVLEGLEVDKTVRGELLPVAYEQTFMNPEFITLGLGPLAGARTDDPRVFFTYTDELVRGHTGRLISEQFSRFVAVGLVEWMVCPSFRYMKTFIPQISLKYVQICKVVDIDHIVSCEFLKLGYSQILAEHTLPIYRRDGRDVAVAAYNRCPKDHAFTLSVGSDDRGEIARVHSALSAILKTQLNEAP